MRGGVTQSRRCWGGRFTDYFRLLAFLAAIASSIGWQSMGSLPVGMAG